MVISQESRAIGIMLTENSISLLHWRLRSDLFRVIKANRSIKFGHADRGVRATRLENRLSIMVLPCISIRASACWDRLPSARVCLTSVDCRTSVFKNHGTRRTFGWQGMCRQLPKHIVLEHQGLQQTAVLVHWILVLACDIVFGRNDAWRRPCKWRMIGQCRVTK